MTDWKWVIKKVDKRLGLWCNRWLSMGGRVVLAVLNAILFYLLSLTNISKFMLNEIKERLFDFLWVGRKKSYVFHLVKWEVLAHPYNYGGWDLKNVLCFSALATKTL
jgi:hypothetical protein